MGRHLACPASLSLPQALAQVGLLSAASVVGTQMLLIESDDGAIGTSRQYSLPTVRPQAWTASILSRLHIIHARACGAPTTWPRCAGLAKGGCSRRVPRWWDRGR